MSIVCTICQDLVTERPQRLADGDDLQITALKCGHLFHGSCILEWFQKLGRIDNGQCPCCKVIVSLAEGLRIFPSGDEESTAIAETLGNAKACSVENGHLRGELDQINQVLEETGCQLENERVNHEILKFEFAQKLSEVDELQRQLDEKEKMVDTTEKNWKGIVDKVSGERQEALEKLKIMERRLSEDKVEIENRFVKKIEELECKFNVSGLEQKMTHQLVDHADKSCQTDGRDAALLQARLVSYKSCLLHMESEVRLLEEEYGKLEIQKSSEAGHSKRNFDCAMDFFPDNPNKKDASIWDSTFDSNDFTSIEFEGGDTEKNVVKELLLPVEALEDDIQIESKVGLITFDAPPVPEEVQSIHTIEEYSDAPLWNQGVELIDIM